MCSLGRLHWIQVAVYFSSRWKEYFCRFRLSLLLNCKITNREFHPNYMFSFQRKNFILLFFFFFNFWKCLSYTACFMVSFLNIHTWKLFITMRRQLFTQKCSKIFHWCKSCSKSCFGNNSVFSVEQQKRLQNQQVFVLSFLLRTTEKL